MATTVEILYKVETLGIIIKVIKSTTVEILYKVETIQNEINNSNLQQ